MSRYFADASGTEMDDARSEDPFAADPPSVAELTLEQRMACALAEIARSAWDGGVDHDAVTEAMYRFDLLTREVMTAKEAEAWGYQMDIAEGDDYDKLSPDILRLENAVPRSRRV